jgi:hypothetical protein
MLRSETSEGNSMNMHSLVRTFVGGMALLLLSVNCTASARAQCGEWESGGRYPGIGGEVYAGMK